MLWVLFDGTDSMAIEDKLPESQQRKLAESVALKPRPIPAPRQCGPACSRLRAWITSELG